jgi:phosphoserine aminotransferase
MHSVTQRHNAQNLAWVSTTEALPVPHKRVLTWMNVARQDPAACGTPMFGVYDRENGFSVDFSIQYMDEITHFVEIKDPQVDGTNWQTIDKLPTDLSYQEELILWCGNGAVMGFKSDDLEDPERDENGFVMDWRWRTMSAPTHFMFMQDPTFEKVA